MDDVAPRAVVPQRSAEPVEAVLVDPQQLGGDGDLGLRAGLAVDEQQVAGHAALAGRVDHLRREHLQRVEVEAAAGDHRETLLEALGEEEVGQHHHHAAADAAGADEAHRLLEPGAALGLAPQEPRRDIGGLAAPAQVRRALDMTGREADERHAVLVHEADIGERHRDLARVVERVGIAGAHRGAGVDGDDEREVLLLEEHLEEEAVEAAEDVPVDEAEVVAVDVRAEVGELDRLAAATRAALALQLAREDLAAHDVDRVEARHEGAVDEVVELAEGLHGGHAAPPPAEVDADTATARGSSVGVAATTRRAISSLVRPSLSASNERWMRWRSAARATLRASSKLTA